MRRARSLALPVTVDLQTPAGPCAAAAHTLYNHHPTQPPRPLQQEGQGGMPGAPPSNHTCRQRQACTPKANQHTPSHTKPPQPAELLGPDHSTAHRLLLAAQNPGCTVGGVFRQIAGSSPSPAAVAAALAPTAIWLVMPAAAVTAAVHMAQPSAAVINQGEALASCFGPFAHRSSSCWWAGLGSRYSTWLQPTQQCTAAVYCRVQTFEATHHNLKHRTQLPHVPVACQGTART